MTFNLALTIKYQRFLLRSYGVRADTGKRFTRLFPVSIALFLLNIFDFDFYVVYFRSLPQMVQLFILVYILAF